MILRVLKLLFGVTFFIIIPVIAFSFFEPQHGVNSTEPLKHSKSPHKDDIDCKICHIASKDDLKSWFTFSSTKRKMIADPVVLCVKCHGTGFGHGTGKKPDINVTDLPLNTDGTITCAITCHNMHISEFKDKAQERFYLRYDNVKLCKSCHNK